MTNLSNSRLFLRLLGAALLLAIAAPAHSHADPAQEILPSVREIGEMAATSAGAETAALCTRENSAKLRDKIITAQIKRIQNLGYANEASSAIAKAEALRGTAFVLSAANLVMSIYTGRAALMSASKAASQLGWSAFLTALRSWDKSSWVQAWAMGRAVTGPIKELGASFAIASSIYKDHQDTSGFKQRLSEVAINLSQLGETEFDQYHRELSQVALPPTRKGFWSTFQGASDKASADLAFLHGYLYAVEEATYSEIFKQYAATCLAASAEPSGEPWQVSALWMGPCMLKREKNDVPGTGYRYVLYADTSLDSKITHYSRMEPQYNDYNPALEALLTSPNCNKEILQ